MSRSVSIVVVALAGCGGVASQSGVPAASIEPSATDQKAPATVPADPAAQAYHRIDQRLRAQFDYATGHQRWSGDPMVVRERMRKCVEHEGEPYLDELGGLTSESSPKRVAVAARARQGSVYRSCLSGLLQLEPPALQLYTPKEESLLGKLAQICKDLGSEKACQQDKAFRENRKKQWQRLRQQLKEPVEREAVRGYAEALLWARAFQLDDETAGDARAQLDSFSRDLGDEVMASYLAGLTDPMTKAPLVYQKGMFLRSR